MDTKVSYRSINIECPQIGPKTGSVALMLGEWLEYSSGLLAPLAPATPVVGLNLTPVPATSVTNDLITFDGVNSTEDRFVMPVANTLVYNTLAVSTFAVGELVFQGATLLTATAVGQVVADNGSTTMVISPVNGIFTTGSIKGATSGSTAVFASVTAIASTNIGASADIAADSISLDVSTIGTGTQFVITQIISPTQVEVAVKLLAL